MKIEWISAKDKLPKDADSVVLVIVSGSPQPNIRLINAYEFGLYSTEDGWIIEAYPEWETAEVSYWMPLPELPPEAIKTIQEAINNE